MTDEREDLAAKLELARDLLMERKQGNPARSPAHNARLVIEQALSTLSGEAKGEDVGALKAALRFYRDQWTFHAVGDEGDGVTDMGRLDGYEATPTNALLKDGGDLARSLVSEGVIRASSDGTVEVSATPAQPKGEWVTVPREPTVEMIGAFWRQKNRGSQEPGKTGPNTDDYSDYAACAAMIAAAPAPAPTAVPTREDAQALRFYRAASHWIGADAWDGCGDCMEVWRRAAEHDVGRDMTPDEIALALRDLGRLSGLNPLPAQPEDAS